MSGRQIGAAIMDVAYGIKAVDNDPLIKLANDGNHYTADASVPGRYLVETLTWLKYVPAWVPGASFKRKAAEAKALLKDVGSVPFQIVKRAIVRDWVRLIRGSPLNETRPCRPRVLQVPHS